MNILKLETTNFDNIVNDPNSKPTIIDFYADWCGPCKMIAPILEELANENQDIQICKLNIDDNPELATKYSVMTIPTLISFKDGKEYKRNVGVIQKEMILELVK